MAETVDTPSELTTPAFMMNFPRTVDNEESNNPWMKATEGEPYNYELAYRQWRDVYSQLAQDDSVVYLMPDLDQEFQDLTFVANIGAVLPHKGGIVLSSFKSKPRQGEEKVGEPFFEMLGYKTWQCPEFWEGEADLKYLRDNIYVGGHGIRSDLKAYDWMTEELDCQILPMRMTDKKLYHFDCVLFPIDGESALVSVDVLDKADVKKLEQLVDIIPVPKEYVYDSWTNSVRFKDKILTNIPRAPSGEEKKASRKELERTIELMGYEPVLIDLDEFRKSGADLSCLVFHFNYRNRD